MSPVRIQFFILEKKISPGAGVFLFSPFLSLCFLCFLPVSPSGLPPLLLSPLLSPLLSRSPLPPPPPPLLLAASPPFPSSLLPPPFLPAPALFLPALPSFLCFPSALPPSPPLPSLRRVSSSHVLSSTLPLLSAPLVLDRSSPPSYTRLPLGCPPCPRAMPTSLSLSEPAGVERDPDPRGL